MKKNFENLSIAEKFKQLDNMMSKPDNVAPKKEKKLATYKQSLKTTKKDQLQERNIIKSEILLLAKELHSKNKINKPLYTKLYNISIGASRLPKLQATLETLKEMSKNDDQAFKKTHFNEKLKDSKNEAKMVYNVYKIGRAHV